MDHVKKSVANLLMVDLAWSFLAIFLYLYVFKMDSVFRGCLKRSFSNEHNSSVSPRIPIEFGYTIKYRLSSHMPLQLFPNLSDNYAKICCKHDAGFRRFPIASRRGRCVECAKKNIGKGGQGPGPRGMAWTIFAVVLSQFVFPFVDAGRGPPTDFRP